jgi:TonB family protein
MNPLLISSERDSMDSFLGLENIAPIKPSPKAPSHRAPALLVELEPWGRSFRGNLGDFLLRRRPPTVATTSAPAPFWPDVFVPTRLPWSAFAESILYHAVVLALAWGLTTLFARQPRIAQRRPFDPSDVIYYSPSEYLPPLDTGTSHATKALKGEPALAKQPILSVPPESDNRHQTIVTPPNIKLTQDVPTPNIVAWGNRDIPIPLAATERKPSPLPALPNQIVAPAPELDPSARRNLASLSESVVAPPPDADSGKVRAVASLSIEVVAPAPDATAAASHRPLNSPQPSIVEPPPAMNAADVRKLGELNIGRAQVVAPAPQLAVPSQRALPTLGGTGKAVVPPPPSMDAANGSPASATGSRAFRTQAGLSGSSQQVVPPPPSVQGARSTEGGGRLIALGIHPAVAPPPNPPHGNRRGTFAAGPDGKPDAAGTPDLGADNSGYHGVGGDSGRNGTGGTGSGAASDAPPGLHVGAPAHPPTSATAGNPSSNPSNGAGFGDPRGRSGPAAEAPSTVASASPGRSAREPRVDVIDNPSPLEVKVFGGRRLYSMTLNMPNLNSAGGSYVIRFAELNNNSEQPGQLIAPVAEHKVDPAYPIQLMQENVSGTVTLRAIIHADGTVGDIRVVNGADQRLDRYAADAVSHWHFLPAMKNGSNVDVEAIVMIPFKPVLRKPF